MLVSEARSAAVLALGLVLAACDRPPAGSADSGGVAGEAEFVGSAVCGQCHSDQLQAWQGSHHDLALQQATASSVSGDFEDSEFQAHGVATRFSTRDGAYFVETEGPDGAYTEYQVAYAFGVEPLQQYVLDVGNGRLQALSVAWDTRPEGDGGQRWFHLYGEEPIPAGDPLHWTGPLQNWNSMCADCHSTGVVKGFDLETDSYATTFVEEDVGCEACHGPGSRHSDDPAAYPLRLSATDRQWLRAAGEAIASLDGPQRDAREPEVCAQCHSRRAQLQDARPLAEFLHGYRPEWLSRDLYYDDGQVRDEVYVYGSFLQSRMHAAGVTCSDCHDAHSLAVKVDGDGLCAQCHSAAEFGVESHHRHESVDPGAGRPGCRDCHMREEVFMQIDARRDHSFRVPRPDLSVDRETPNACNDCHAAEGPAWAATQIDTWFPGGRATAAHPGATFAEVRDWQIDRGIALVDLINDSDRSGILRATALSELGPSIESLDGVTLDQLAADSSPLVQLALIDSARELSPARRVDVLQHFLTDSRLVFRAAAAEALQGARSELGAGRRDDLDAALAEAIAARAFGSDRPEGLVGSATIRMIEGRNVEARNLLRLATERFPWFGPAYVNLADIERAAGRDEAALEVAESGLRQLPQDDSLHVAYALALVRLGRLEEAVVAFAEAVDIAPDTPYNAYLYAVALDSAGSVDLAVEVLQAAADRFPAYADLWFALATMARDRGDLDAASRYATEGRSNVPTDSRFLQLLEAFGEE